MLLSRLVVIFGEPAKPWTWPVGLLDLAYFEVIGAGVMIYQGVVCTIMIATCCICAATL